MPTRDHVFISYSHKDRDWFERLQIVLKPFIRKNVISIWHDTDIQAGDQWRNQIAEALQNARVAVLLVSPDFLASDFIADHELRPLLRAAQDEGLTIVWVLVRDCLFSETEIADYQAAHDIKRPLAMLTVPEVDTALVGIARRVKGALATQPTASEVIVRVQQEATDTKWVLVAGSGIGSLHEKIAELSRRLGRSLAASGFGLISGGRQGVDYIVARSFAETVKETEGNLGERLIQFMARGRTPDFPEGRFVTANSDRHAWEQSTARAEAVILVGGGVGGTYETGEIARRQGKPVLPLADTRYGNASDAYRTYFETLDSWNIQPITGLSREDFEDLSAPAPAVAADALRLLKRLFGLQPQPISSAAPRRSGNSAALELWNEKLEYLQQQEAVVADPATKLVLKKQIQEGQGKINDLSD